MLEKMLGNKEKVNEFVETCLGKLGKLNGTDFKK